MRVRNRIAALAMASGLLLWSASAFAQAGKAIKTTKGKSVMLVTLLSPRPDCSAVPGAVALPRLVEKPAHGAIQLIIVPRDIAASGACPARKIPSIAIVYTPAADYVGADAVKIEIEESNRSTTLSYDIAVSEAGRQL